MEIAWLPVTVIGAAVLGAVLFWGWLQSRKGEAAADPHTPSDDPAKGMHTPPTDPNGPAA